MRLMWLVAICLLALMTTTAYRPLLDCTIATADPAMVLLAWLALIDRMPRILVAMTIIGLLRIWFGIAEIADTFVPLLAVIVSVRLLRQYLDPYHPWKRFQILVPALLVGVILQWILLTGSLVGAGELVLWSLLLSVVITGLLSPILDLMTPLLRSARYPL
ncbi:MAG: hypothetical protein AAEJ65_01170 [Planctomycetota bacterium]